MSLIVSGGYGPAANGPLNVRIASGPIPKFEAAIGVIDGVNTDFSTSSRYVTGSTAIFLNGQLLRSDYANGWTETDPENGLFTMNEAPLAGDVVQVFYLDADFEGASDTVVAPLRGILYDCSDLKGRISSESIIGKVVQETQLSARLEDGSLKATVSNQTAITGHIRSCDK